MRAKRDDGDSDGEPLPEPMPEPVSVSVPPPPPMMEPPPNPTIGDTLRDLPAVQAEVSASSSGSDITVTGTRIEQPNLQSVTPITVLGQQEVAAAPKPPASTVGSEPPPLAEVKAAEWDSDRPYLAALKAAPPERWERVLAEQQAAHGTLPAFWFDVSEFYHRAGRRGEALRLLLSALELPTRDSETLGIVAERLVRWGDLDRAAPCTSAGGDGRDHPHPARAGARVAKRAAGKRGEAATPISPGDRAPRGRGAHRRRREL